jgi:hypothetical protein
VHEGLISVTPLQFDLNHGVRLAAPPFVVPGFERHGG